MYGWERQLRLSRAGPALRQAHRRAHSRMVVERCYRALHLLRPRYLPQSPDIRGFSLLTQRKSVEKLEKKDELLG